MSDRTSRIIALALQEEKNISETANIEKIGKRTDFCQSENEKKEEVLLNPQSDILSDLKHVPIIFLQENLNSLPFSLIENNVDEAEYFVGSQIELYNVEGCFEETKTSSIICDKSTLENINCDNNYQINEDFPGDGDMSTVEVLEKESKIGSSLVPYDFSSDEDEFLGATNNQIKDNFVSDENIIIDETYESSDTNSSRESSRVDKIDSEEDVGVESENIVGDITVESENMNSGRKRKIIANEEEWIRNKNKKLRMKGKAYIGFSRKKGEKIKQNCPRKARSLKETCNSIKCRNSKLRYCPEFQEHCRKEIFRRFWNLTWDQRNVFIASHVLKTPTFKKTKEQSRRLGTYSYYLNDGNDKLQVCRKMFINTLDIGYKTIQYWVDNSSYGMSERSSGKLSTRDVVKRRYCESYKYLGMFFDSLPKLPSHYCRHDSLKLYLEYSFRNMKQLYEVYVNEFCKEKFQTPLGRIVFSKVFKEKNLAL